MYILCVHCSHFITTASIARGLPHPQFPHNQHTIQNRITISYLIFTYIFADKEIIVHATTLSFRADNDLAEQTRTLANFVGLKSSDYIRQAVRERNERVMAQRIAALSRELSVEHLTVNESLEGSLTDGLD